MYMMGKINVCIFNYVLLINVFLMHWRPIRIDLIMVILVCFVFLPFPVNLCQRIDFPALYHVTEMEFVPK